jgi:hypothetical protein
VDRPSRATRWIVEVIIETKSSGWQIWVHYDWISLTELDVVIARWLLEEYRQQLQHKIEAQHRDLATVRQVLGEG